MQKTAQEIAYAEEQLNVDQSIALQNKRRELEVLYRLNHRKQLEKKAVADQYNEEIKKINEDIGGVLNEINKILFPPPMPLFDGKPEVEGIDQED